MPCVGPSQGHGGTKSRVPRVTIRQVVAWAYHPSVKVSSQKSVEGRLRRLLAYVGVLCLPIRSDWQVAGVGSIQVFYMLVDTLTMCSSFRVHFWMGSHSLCTASQKSVAWVVWLQELASEAG